ncbi:hypothetical protein CapIbe_022299 [Capra ibex]
MVLSWGHPRSQESPQRPGIHTLPVHPSPGTDPRRDERQAPLLGVRASSKVTQPSHRPPRSRVPRPERDKVNPSWIVGAAETCLQKKRLRLGWPRGYGCNPIWQRVKPNVDGGGKQQTHYTDQDTEAKQLRDAPT